MSFLRPQDRKSLCRFTRPQFCPPELRLPQPLPANPTSGSGSPCSGRRGSGPTTGPIATHSPASHERRIRWPVGTCPDQVRRPVRNHPTPNPFRINTYRDARKCWALLTSSMNETMPQAVEVVGKAEQQSLADLRGQAASRGARGELAFDGRENAFDLGALAVRFFRKGSEHLIPNGAVGDTPAPRGNDALRSQALPNVFVIGFRVKLRIRQHHTKGSASCRRIQQSRQRARVTPRPLTGSLCQQKSVAAHPPQSATSTKDGEAWSRAHAAPDAGGRRC
jgi:hypothetical protein